MQMPPFHLLTIDEVKRITSLSRATLYRRMKEGTFPQAIKIGERRVAWRSDQLMAWLENCAPC